MSKQDFPIIGKIVVFDGLNIFIHSSSTTELMGRADGKSLILVPYVSEAARENFERTVQQKVPATGIAEFTDRRFTTESVSLWGTKTSIKNRWEKIEEGDVILFYRDQKYRYCADVIGKEQNRDLGAHVWGNYDDDPWECILYLDNLREIAISQVDFNEIVNYSPDFRLQGLQRLINKRHKLLTDQYGSVDEFLEEIRVGGDKSGVDVHAKFTSRISPDVFGNLYFPDRVASALARDITAALQSGKHIVFTGPPGTGKTEIARAVSEHVVEPDDSPFTGYQLTTATADWSTFDTVGGYMPNNERNGTLEFKPGQILRRFKGDEGPVNELLVIDEINRADIDKAFGQLFTLLSGQGVQLPFERGGKEIEILPADKFDGRELDVNLNQYVVPESWRILATMNSYDKTSLYEMSYAFMRRFAFIRIDAPDIPADSDRRLEMIKHYVDSWDDVDPNEIVLRSVADVWNAVNSNGRKIGPAIVKDILGFVGEDGSTNLRAVLTRGVTSYVFPQLEGVPERKNIVNALASIEHINGRKLESAAEEMLNVTLSDTNE